MKKEEAVPVAFVLAIAFAVATFVVGLVAPPLLVQRYGEKSVRQYVELFVVAEDLWKLVLWVTLAAFVLAWIVGSLHFLSRAEAQRRRREADEAEQRFADAQRSNFATLARCYEEVTKGGPNLIQYLDEAERAIQTAEREFREGVFAPFWDAIERCTHRLATFDKTVASIRASVQQYKLVKTRTVVRVPDFDVGLTALPDASKTAERMRNLVRKAQANFHFASIFEQRKTNRILVEGFTTLSSAIDELSGNLHQSLSELSSTIEKSIVDLHSGVTEELRGLRKDAAEGADHQREHERMERDLLNNIQRRRRPLTFESDIGFEKYRDSSVAEQ